MPTACRSSNAWPSLTLAHLRSPGAALGQPARVDRPAAAGSAPPPPSSTGHAAPDSHQPSDDSYQGAPVPYRRIRLILSRAQMFSSDLRRLRTGENNCERPGPSSTLITTCSHREATRDNDSPIPVPQSQTPYGRRDRNTVPFEPV